MTFVNFAMLSGVGLIAIPIILHLIMRRKPKLLEFPALRFIRKRHDSNQRRLRLRHLLLLLLRAGAIALLALALARPSIKFSSGLGSQEAPVAAALIFDAAPHMQYVRDKKTRLQAAQEVGQWLLSQLPLESQIAVFDSGATPRTFDADRGLSSQRISKLEVVPNPRPLSQVVGEAADVLNKQNTLPTKELYVFTDLSQASWRPEDAAKLQERLHELAGVTVYLIDVGVSDPTNLALGDLRLSHQIIAAGGSVDIQTEISSLGVEGQRKIELELIGSSGTLDKASEQTEQLLIGSSGTLVKNSEQIVQLKPGETQSVDFRLTSLKPGTQQGRIKVVGKDSLPEDDVRYFSIEVRPPWPVLIVAQEPAEQSAIYLAEAIAPAKMRSSHSARFDCKIIGYRELATWTLEKLEPYAAIALLDPPGLEAAIWQTLTNYAAAGHGVGIFLGRHAAPIEAFNSPAAQQILPGKLTDQVPRENGNTYLAPQNYQHTILKPFETLATRTPWSMFPVYRYWRIDPLARDASTVIAYNDGRPALLERTIGAGQVVGHVLVTSTPFSDRVSRRDAWNVLPGSAEMKAWPFMILANQIMSYLVGSGEQQLNYPAGTKSVLLPVGGGQRHYTLTRPDRSEMPLPPPEKAQLSISSVEQVGNYQVHCVEEPYGAPRGFSVNLSAQATQLARLTDQELSEMFGPFKPQVARSNDQIVRNVHEGRVGREIYPWLILVFAALLAIEYVVSNWFYQREAILELRS
jgi:hypothetical protein